MNAIDQYKNVDLSASVQTASPHQLITMLMRGALESLAKARGAIQRNQFDSRSKQINKALSIVMELQECLDTEKGGELAANLQALYAYITKRLVEANRENSEEILEEITGLLAEVLEGWAGIPPEYHKQLD